MGGKEGENKRAGECQSEGGRDGGMGTKQEIVSHSGRSETSALE